MLEIFKRFSNNFTKKTQKTITSDTLTPPSVFIFLYIKRKITLRLANKIQFSSTNLKAKEL